MKSYGKRQKFDWHIAQCNAMEEVEGKGGEK